jgi:type IV secretory pathway VirB4 component
MKGITPDPETQKKTPPLMEDLFKALIGMEDPLSRSMADRIEKFVKGSFAGIIDQPSNVTLKNPFTVFSVRDLEDSLKPIAIFIILDYIWTKMRRDLKRRLLVVDEAWYLMRNPDSAAFLYGIAKRCRKYFMGLTTITQDVEDFLGSDYGKPIVTNSSIQILMKQSPAAIDKVQQVFYLSEGEKHLLMSAAIGEGLFFAGNNHVAIRFVSSPDEHKFITTRPQDILKQQQEAAAPPDQKPRLITEIEKPK